jgi:general secretion pathway protein A
MSRTLLQNFAGDDNFIFHIILDPTFKSEFQFLSSLVKIFGISPNSRSTLDYKEEIKNYLFKKGVDEKKTVVLLIDEGQKLTAPFLEMLRMLLNYETNEYKLLQLVIVSQMELLPRVKKIRNFYDRIGLKYIINPLDENETRSMIEFRLKEAGLDPGRRLFTPEAARRVFERSQGYPRKIAILCHNALEAAIMHEKGAVDEKLVDETASKEAV